MRSEELKKNVKEGLREYGQTGLRWSYLVIAVMAVLGAVVNLFLPHGWVVWPAVLAIGIMVLINEAATRNTQGVPPLVVYGWVIVALAVWVAMAVIFSKIFPILVVAGIPLMCGYGIYAYFKNRNRQRLLADRRGKGLCIHCAAPLDGNFDDCPHCGKEQAQEKWSLLKRMQPPDRTAEDVARARDLLTPKPPTVAAKRKEEALLAQRPRSTAQKTPGPPLGPPGRR
jgi:hypothetical protein